MQPSIITAKNIINEADAIIITAGAGMSVDSGLPDFRGDQGFWRAYPPLKDKNLSFTDMANPQWFFSNPKLAWAFYGHRLKLYNATTPHEGFYLLRELCKEKDDNYFIYTSNVDGHFAKAGFDKDKIYECHGSIHYTQCIYKDDGAIWAIDENEIEVDEDKFEATKMPTCKECGCVMRPNILMFYDGVFNWNRTKAQYHRYDAWLSKNMNSKIAIIEIGAGLAVPTIRAYGERMAKRFNKANLIRINPTDTKINPYCGVSIKMGGLEALKAILC